MLRTDVRVTVWPVKDPDLISTVPGFTVDQRFVDIDGDIEMGNAEGTTSLTLWNVGTPREAYILYRPDNVLALDIAVGVGRNLPPFSRPVLGRIKTFRPTDDDRGNIGVRLEVEPLSNLQQFEIHKSYPARDGGYDLAAIMTDMLTEAGLGPLSSVDLTRTYTIEGFTARGPILSEVERVADLAGVTVGAFMQGGLVVVSDHFTAGVVVTDDDVFDAYPVYDRNSTAPPPAPPAPDAGAPVDGVDLADTYDPGVDDQTQLALPETPPEGAFEVVMRLAGNIYPGTKLVVRAPQALERMGLLGTSEQVFNVLNIKMHFTTEAESNSVDEMTLSLALTKEDSA